MSISKKDKDGLFKNIFVAYFILLLHVFLLAGIGVTVVLFKGIYHYLPWIMGGIVVFVLTVAWIIYRRMRTTSESLSEVLGMPQFQDRAVEVKLLGGVASFEIKAKQTDHLLPEHAGTNHDPGDPGHAHPMYIEDAAARTERKMLELNTLYEKDLITKEEYEAARQTIIQG